MTDIDILARTAYDTGIDPIEYATVNVVQAHIDIHLTGCAHPPLAATGALSCRIVADLMNAGWRAPEVTP